MNLVLFQMNSVVSFKTRYLTCFSFFFILLGSGWVYSKEKPHKYNYDERGSAAFTMVIDRNSVVIDFDSPAINIVGFEHLPKSVEDNTKVDKAVRIFKNSRNVVRFSKAAKCQQIHTTISSSLLGSSQTEIIPSSGSSSGHETFKVGYQIECRKPANIHKAEFQIFNTFSAIQKLHGQWVIGDKQGVNTLTPSSNSIQF